MGINSRATKPRAARFRAKAAQCEKAGRLAVNRHLKQTYLDLAKQWRELANQAEFLDSSK